MFRITPVQLLLLRLSAVCVRVWITVSRMRSHGRDGGGIHGRAHHAILSSTSSQRRTATSSLSTAVTATRRTRSSRVQQLRLGHSRTASTPRTVK